MKIKSLLATSFLVAVSACSDNSGFDYSNSEDTFTNAVVTTALASQQGDVDKNAYLQLSLTCEYKSGEEPDPAQARLSALVADKDAQPYELENMSLKINNHAIIESDVLTQLDLSKYENERLVTYADIYMVSVFDPADGNLMEQAALLMSSKYIWHVNAVTSFMETLSNDSPEFAKAQSDITKVTNGYVDTKTISIRYETTNGQVNTAEFSVEGKNFKRVMADCGWETFPGKHAKEIEAAVAAAQETAQARVYPPEAQENFVNSCTAAGATMKYCSCTLGILQPKFSYEEFLKEEAKIQLGSPTSDAFITAMAEARGTCSL